MGVCEIDLKKEVPDYVLREPDQVSMLEVFNEGANQMCEDIELIGDAHDFDRAESKFLDLMLLEVAWTVDIDLTDNQKRIIIKFHQTFFDQAGTNQGIQFAIRKIFGILCNVTNATGSGSNQFIVEDDSDEDRNFLGASFDNVLGDTSKLFSFVVDIETVTAQIESDIRKVVNFLRWAPSEYTVAQIL